jgi:hypothetical protein
MGRKTFGSLHISERPPHSLSLTLSLFLASQKIMKLHALIMPDFKQHVVAQ